MGGISNFKSFVLTICTVFGCLELSVFADHWAVIVVGSRGYWNYRHQADACHAYHVIREHGIPQDRIILMMYNDVANDPRNPFNGTLYNRPSITNGDGVVIQPANVYKDCKVDYEGDSVTPQNFMNVLLGNATGTNGKPVLKSTDKDRIFINFVDHGADGFIVFPQSKKLTMKQLHETLLQMEKQKMYKELVFYMEACHSGSMFHQHMSSINNVYVTTAANRFESSWATYCPPHDRVHNVSLGTCLGDLYSVNWMEDSDKMNLTSETLAEQYLKVKAETIASHVKEFGSKTVEKEVVGNFQSNKDKLLEQNDESLHREKVLSVADTDNTNHWSQVLKDVSSVNAHDVELIGQFYQYIRAETNKDRKGSAKTLIDTILRRIQADEVFDSLQIQTNDQNQVKVADSDEHWDCYTKALKVFESQCNGLGDADLGGAFTSYSLRFTQVLSQLCVSFSRWEDIEVRIQRACFKYKIKSNPFIRFNDQALAVV